MQIVKDDERLFWLLFDSTEIHFLRHGMKFDASDIETWLRDCISNRLTGIGYCKLGKEKVNELER